MINGNWKYGKGGKGSCHEPNGSVHRVSSPKGTTPVLQYECMVLFLERTDTIQPLEKNKIEETLTMYDRLWEESPRVQKTKARLREEAKKEAEQYKEQIKREAEQAKKEAEQISRRGCSRKVPDCRSKCKI